MDFTRLTGVIAAAWNAQVMPSLTDYIGIPCLSPAFDAGWAATGHIERAATLIAGWARDTLHSIPGASVEILTLPGRTPVVFIDIPGSSPDPVLIYGHLDKQPAMSGWSRGRSAWVPRQEGDRLYGRGGADDGYAIYAAVLAVIALRDQGLDHARCQILIEASEESGSDDLPFYVDHLASRLGSPSVVVALDAGAGDYETLWLTTSLRGQVAGTLTVRVLTESVHSGDGAGVAPSSFRIARHLLSRLEDPVTGEIIRREFQVEIPKERRDEAEAAAARLGRSYYDALPFASGVGPVTEDVVELMLNRAWRPALVVTGVDGLPATCDASAVLHSQTALKLSLRLPPTLDAEAAAMALTATLEADPPYGCEVAFRCDMQSPGWHAPPTADWLGESLGQASRQAFGAPAALIGGGGGIPFLSMLGDRFPAAQFVVTGVLGPQSNAHGPNEFLHIPTAIRLTAVMACLLRDAAVPTCIPTLPAKDC